VDSNLLALLIAVFGLLLLTLGVRRLTVARFFSAAGSFLGGALLLAIAGLLFAVSLNLQTYSRLTYESPVADLVFEGRGTQQYRATLAKIPAGDLQIFLLNGDEWQLDARVLKWRGWANLFGLNAEYRLERVSGRYRDVEQERHGPRSVYGLTENPGIDLWTLALQYPQRLPFIDSVYGSATYMPMADGARYRVSLTQSGLIARPLNEAAVTASRNWK